MKAMALKDDLKLIADLGFTPQRTARCLDLSPDTLEGILHRTATKAKAKKPSTSKTKRIPYFREVLVELSEGGINVTEETLESITPLPGKNFFEFIKENYSGDEELVSHLIHQSVEAFLNSRMRINFVAVFEKRFGSVTEESLAHAATTDPQFLADFLSLGKIKPLTKALGLSKLGESHDEAFIGQLKSSTKDEAPLVREGAFQGLAEYFFFDEKKYSDLLLFFREALANETGIGVQKQIRNLIEAMELYQE